MQISTANLIAAQQAAQNAASMARDHGVRSVEVRVSGPGSGRESAIRALAAIQFRRAFQVRAFPDIEAGQMAAGGKRRPHNTVGVHVNASGIEKARAGVYPKNIALDAPYR